MTNDDWDEYRRRLKIREDERTRIHQMMGFTDAPYTAKLRWRSFGNPRKASPLGKSTQKKRTRGGDDAS